MSQKFSFFLLGILVGGILVQSYHVREHRKAEKELSKEDAIRTEEVIKTKSIIDSLDNEICLRESVIDSFSLFRDSIKIERVEKIEKLQQLPASESVKFLKNNLEYYEKIYNTTPTLLPSL